MDSNPFMCGVVEGFYGRPWSAAQRRQLFEWMHAWGLNTYLYAPKDDLKHRVHWRALYGQAEAAELKVLVDDCQGKGIRFIYAIAPGLSPDYDTDASVAAMERKLEQMSSLGCRDFALLFDDIVPMAGAGGIAADDNDARRQADVANALFGSRRANVSSLMFCPTPYCGRMAGPVRESAYLGKLGRSLHEAIPVLWTGPEIISESITAESVEELATVLRRKPVIWDNLHANDYDMRRIYLGPYSGRPTALRAETAGVLSNPNCEFEANFVPLRTLAMWARAGAEWQPRAAYLAALKEWLPEWKSVPAPSGERGGAITPEPTLPLNLLNLLELLGDCLYLPFGHGAEGQRLLDDFQHLLRTPPSGWGQDFFRFAMTCARVETLFQTMTTLENRSLLHALYRHVWELKEEMQLLRSYLCWLVSKPGLGDVFTSAEHRPKTYRGGIVAELQRLLPIDEAGEFNHRPSLIPRHDPNPYR